MKKHPFGGSSLTRRDLLGFTCPRHGARSDSTGTWIGGQRTSSMRSHPTSYDASRRKLTIG